MYIKIDIGYVNLLDLIGSVCDDSIKTRMKIIFIWTDNLTCIHTRFAGLPLTSVCVCMCALVFVSLYVYAIYFLYFCRTQRLFGT